MNYRYRGAGFRINVKAGETPSDTIKRLQQEQPNADRPTMAMLTSQVRLVHAIEDLAASIDFEQAQKALVSALREVARQTHGLDMEV